MSVTLNFKNKLTTSKKIACTPILAIALLLLLLENYHG
jgi:hypothetical protein